MLWEIALVVFGEPLAKVIVGKAKVVVREENKSLLLKM